MKSAFKTGGMFEGASSLIFQYASDLRKRMTSAEAMLWSHLKDGIDGYKFRRRHPISNYIADFYCHKLKLVIEVDGGVPDNSDSRISELQRELEVRELNCSILRFSNYEVLKNLVSVLEKYVRS